MSDSQTSFIFSVPFPVQEIKQGLANITLQKAAGHAGAFPKVLKNFRPKGRIWQILLQILIYLASYANNIKLEKL